MKAGVTKQQFIKSLEATLKLTREEIESLELQQKYQGVQDKINAITGTFQGIAGGAMVGSLIGGGVGAGVGSGCGSGSGSGVGIGVGVGDGVVPMHTLHGL